MSTGLQIAARIANPWHPAPLSEFGDAELAAAGRMLAAQKVSLIALRDTHGNDVLDTPLGEFVERDRERYRRERGEYEEIRLRFEEAGVRSMLFKSTGLFPSFHYLSSNLDVIVPDGQAAAARSVLAGLGYVELLNVEEPKKFLFRRFSGDGTSFAFHLHEQVGWGVPFVDNAPLWANARQATDDPDVLIPGPVEALLITLAHWFYEDKSLSLGNLFLTANALRELRLSLPTVAGQAAARGWEEGFWAALRIFDDAWVRLFGEGFLDGERRDEVDARVRNFPYMRDRVVPAVGATPDTIAVVPFFPNKVVYYRKVRNDPQRDGLARFKDVVATLLWAVRWKLHIRSQRGMLVTIGGVDGSGKSMQVDRLTRTLDTCDIRYKTVWWRGGSSRFFGLVSRLAKGGGSSAAAVGEADAGKTESERFRERRAALRSPFKRFLFSIVYAVDLKIEYIIKMWWRVLTGNVVVCDRYIEDAMVDYALYTGTSATSPPLSLRLVAFFAPRPRQRFLLDVTADEALRRKPEEGDTEHLDAARQAFLALAERRRVTVLPAEGTPEDIARFIALQSLRSFYADYGTLLNWLLWSNPAQLNPDRK